MTTQSLGRFGRLQQTLLDRTKSEDLQKPSTNSTISSNTKDSINPSEPSETDPSVLAWLKICLSEGHIEPSQPIVGRICGWPLRLFFCESLFTDFECWCLKRGIHPKERPGSEAFYSVADSIFVREGSKYHFPPLEECRKKFKSLIGNKLNI